MDLRTFVSAVSLFAACGIATANVEQDAWPQWRGPNRDATIKASKWPNRLSGDAMTQQWRLKLGPSYSGPIVVDGQVFVTETKNAKQEFVRALSLEDGRENWHVAWDGAMRVPFFARSNGSWIRSTPAFDNGRLYVGGMRDVLVCLDTQTGSEHWRVDFVEDLGTSLPSFGFASSPLVTEDGLYVQAGASLAKLDKESGKVLWRTLKDGGGMSGSAFSSPVMATLLGQRQVVVQTRTSLAGVEPTDGDVLWSLDIPAFRGMNILTPSVSDDTVFTSSYGGKSLMLGLSGIPSKAEVSKKWTNKSQGYMSSPVLINHHIYLHLRNQRFTCINAATGATKWTTKPFGKYWSMVANGDRILALDQNGELLLIAANPEQFEVLDSRKVSKDETWAHLAVVGDRVVIRELNAVAVYRWR